MKKLKSIVILVLSVMMIAGIAACGNEDTTPANGGGAPNDGGAPEEVRLAIYDWFYSFTPIPGAIERFEQENNAVVVINTLQGLEGASLLAITFAAGNPPDVMHIGDWSVRSDILAGRLHPLNDFVLPDEIAQMNQSFAERFSNDGNLYAYMANTDVRLLFYNKAIFEEAGLDPSPEAFPETWSEFTAAMGTLTGVRGPSQYGYAFIGAIPNLHTAIMWDALVRSVGGHVIDPDTNEILLGSPETVRAAEFYKELIDRGYASQGVLGFDDVAVISEFVTGNAAVIKGGSWMLAQIEDAGFNMEDLGWAMLPRADDGIFATIGGAWSLAISSRATNPALSWELISSLYSDEFLIYMITENGEVPTRERLMHAAQHDSYTLWISEYFRNHGQAELHSRYFLEDIDAINIALNAAISGRADIQSIFSETARELNAGR